MDQASQLRRIVSTLREKRITKEKSNIRLVTITSGKGGVGKTNFTANLAISLGKLGFRVLIIDADFGLANINIVLGIPTKYDLSHVLTNQKTIDEIIAEGPDGIKYISGGNGIEQLLSIGNAEIDNYIKLLMGLENLADIILVDTGAGVNEKILKFISASSEVILVTTPEPTALMDAYALTKTVSNTGENVKIKLVVNMAHSVSEAENTIRNFKTLARTYLKMDIEGLGYILFDKSVAEAVRLQEPYVNSFPNSEASKNMRRIVNKFIDQPENLNTNSWHKFLQKFFKR